MRQRLSTLQKVKTCLHVLQAVLIFITMCVQIAVFTSGPGHTDGRSKWFFTMCFLSMPALVYLSAVPMWSRAMNLAKSLWFAIVDILFTILWLSAFASVLAWNKAGIAEGMSKKKPDDDSKADCSIFAFGNEKQCKLSYTAGGFGVVIFLIFIATSTISILYTIKSKKNPQAEDPWLAKDSSSQPYAHASDDLEGSHSKDPIWDTNTQELDGLHDADHDSIDEHHDGDRRGDYASVLNTETDEGTHPGRPWGPLGGGGGHVSMPPLSQVDTEYRGGGREGHNYQAPSALSPDGCHVDSPAGRRPSPVNDFGLHDEYQAAGASYSFSRPDQGR
ncbi:hypothetical protein EJ08DRAFT_643620 [Tothia fuscella]|uniref:MARVEL domain-containing protein n=1 Tax=Tothia fuscella TaxID=1048955 RepID=A0A9P4TS64_9PEZI|nr:hypothetical protein EJ08DRAFT_643620 [Tothia fuscella]